LPELGKRNSGSGLRHTKFGSGVGKTAGAPAELRLRQLRRTALIGPLVGMEPANRRSTQCLFRSINVYFFCVGVMYSGEYDACDVTLSVYPHCIDIEGTRFRSEISHTRTDLTA
jgi:hypothetical protein